MIGGGAVPKKTRLYGNLVAASNRCSARKRMNKAIPRLRRPHPYIQPNTTKSKYVFSQNANMTLAGIAKTNAATSIKGLQLRLSKKNGTSRIV